MKIKSLQLKNFKRFTDLQLQNIPEETKLVLLIGSNGSGKSSIFDSFEMASDLIRGKEGGPYGSRTINFSSGKSYSYYYKNELLSGLYLEFYELLNINCWFSQKNSGSIELNGQVPPNIFYGRSAVRYVPRITRTSIGQAIDVNADADRPKYYIDADQRFENDIDLLIKEVVEKIFQGINTDSAKQLNEIRAFLQRINDAFPHIFGTENGTMLSFKSFQPPADGKPSRLIFQKGISELDYDLLSSGEKEVVNLLFNLFVRSKAYTNTIYFFDEIDTHLNTRLQYNLLKEITENWIPANCQLWTASHSLGFIDYANDSENAVIFDFDDLDFDIPQLLQPKPKNDTEIFEIAVGKAFIDKFVQGRKIIFSENTDIPFYNDLGLEDTLFFTAIDKADAFHKAKNLKQSALIDRDFLGDDEINELKETYPFLYILPFYSFENLMFHPDNLEEYKASQNLPFDKSVYVEALTAIKNKEKDSILIGILLARSGYPFYKENENIKKLKLFKESYKSVVDLLKSDNLNDFYKVFPMREYATQLNERQNISKTTLAKTGWFKKQIESVIVTESKKR